MFCAVFFAKLVADQFGRGIFETYLQLSCVPFLSEPMTSSSISSITNQMTVADVMARGVTALPPVIALSELLHILKTTPFSVSASSSCARQLSCYFALVRLAGTFPALASDHHIREYVWSTMIACALAVHYSHRGSQASHAARSHVSHAI